MWPKIRQYIADHPELFGFAVIPEDLRAILLSRQGFRQTGRQRLTWLILRKGERAPFAVVRHYASPRWNDLMVKEFDLCNNLWAAMDGQLIPQPLALAEIGHLLCSFERGIDGMPLSVELVRRAALVQDRIQLLPLVEDHLSLVYNCIHQLNVLSKPCGKADLEKDVYSIYIKSRASLSQIYPEDALLLDAAFALLYRFVNVAQIETRERVIHRDLVPSNVLRSPQGVFWVDWEYHEASTIWILEPLKFVYWYLVDLAKWAYRADLQMVFEKYLQGGDEPLLGSLDTFLIKCGIPVDDPALRWAAWLLYFMSECDLVLSVARDRASFVNVFLKQFRQLTGQDWLERAKSIHLLAEREREVEGLRVELMRGQEERAILEGRLAEREREVEGLRAELMRGQEERALLEGRLAELKGRLRWKRYQVADRLVAPLWYLRHPAQLARRVYNFLPPRLRLIAKALLKGTIFNKLREPWGLFKDQYIVEDNSCVVLFATTPELFPEYQPQARLNSLALPEQQRVKVTLIAPAKNEADSLDWWWSGILTQTRLPNEIIIVESDSTDGTAERLRVLSAKSPVPFRVISAPGANIAAARNIAVQEASHDIIACIDLGCRPRPDWLEKLVAPFEVDPETQVAAGWYEPVRADRRPLRHRHWWPELRKIWPQNFLPSSRSFAFRKMAWEAVGGYPEWLTLTGEDTYFVLELKRYGGKWAFCPEAVVEWEAPDSIWGYLRKMFYWATGDGESGVHGQYYWRWAVGLATLLGLGAAFTLVFLAALILGVLRPIWAIILAILAMGGLGLIAGVRDPAVLAGRVAAVAGFVVGARRRWLVKARQWGQVKGVWFVLSGVPIDDTGGGARATQVTLEFLRQGYFVVFISKFPKYESRELGLKFVHPNLKTYQVDDFNWPQFVAIYAEVLRGKPIAALVEFPVQDFLPLVKSIRAAGGRVIYDLIDDWSTSLGGTWYCPEIEKAFIEEADVLTATAPVLAERLQELSGREVHLVPNAVNARLFDPNRPYFRPMDMPSADWVMIYIGALWGEWFDWELLIRLADAYPEAAVVVIGDYRGQCPEARPNLHFLGLKPQRELPGYLAHADVAIIPWKVNKITVATSPLKIYEYLTMRRPVVAPDLPPLRGIPGVWLAQDVEDFVRLISVVRNVPYPYKEVDKFISENNWEARIRQLRHLVFRES
ncbi:MAG: glycosyltransferase [Candidatus Methanomethylicaceae archaeon]